MPIPDFSMRELIDAGVHFGHKTKRWNPRMAPFIYGERNNIHIINLQKTVPLLHRALVATRDVASKNGRILFVGTKRQASDVIATAAKRCGQYYVNQRWLGGMLTNWKTIQNSIRQLKKIEETLQNANSGFTKKELLSLQRQHEKLEKSLGGIRDMAGIPDLMVVVDVCREDLAIKEAQKLGIPIVAIVDTNASVDGIDHPIPGNDDATRAITLYCKLLSDAVLDGIQESMHHMEDEMVEEVSMEQEMAAGEEEAPAQSKKVTTKKAAYADVAKKAAKKKEAAETAKKVEKASKDQSSISEGVESPEEKEELIEAAADKEIANENLNKSEDEAASDKKAASA
tara:strand:- start:1591 stop:2616 length:1026 start_codon:yes stop_codon:yes gene_type:complete